MDRQPQDIDPEEMKARKEHSDMLRHLRNVLATDSGKEVFKYLIRELEICELPEIGLTGELLMDKLGSLRSGRAIFKMLSEANHGVAAALLAQVEKENNARIYRELTE